MIVLVLDEVDQLLSSSLSSSKTVLKTVFEWPLITGCRLILVGIANALDLSTHHLPKYFTTSNFEIDKPSTPKPKRSAKNGKSAKESYETNAGFLMHFTPYKKEDIAKILEDRLNGNNIFDPSAIKFVATKVASSSGDIRKALNACKIALESVEQQERRQGLKVTADDGLNPGASPKKQQKMAAMHSTPTKPVGVLALSKVLTSQKDDGAIPLQQAIILLTLHKINSAAPNSKNYIEDGVQSAIPIDRVYTEHLKVCEQHMFPRIDRSDLPSACSMLQDRSLITVIQRAGSCSPSASSPKARGGTLKRGLSIKAHSSGMTGVLFDPRAVEIALRSDPVMNQQLKMH
jgi:cell division control protein 6